MIPAGIVNALVAWASGDDARIASLVTERDALVALFLSGGKPSVTFTSLSANGKSFTFAPNLTATDKLTLLTNVLVQLGVIEEGVISATVSYADFSGIKR